MDCGKLRQAHFSFFRYFIEQQPSKINGYNYNIIVIMDIEHFDSLIQLIMFCFITTKYNIFSQTCVQRHIDTFHIAESIMEIWAMMCQHENVMTILFKLSGKIMCKY